MSATASIAALRSGLRLFYVAAGEGPVVVFCHGWPELHYSWRKQVSALAAAGFRCIAPDMRGFGRTDAPAAAEQYTMEKICNDMVELLDVLRVPKAVFIGHDWGGVVVWELAAHFPHRVAAVAGVNTPRIRRSLVDPVVAMAARPAQFDYQLYFAEVGRAEEEFAADVRRTFCALMRGTGPTDRAFVADVRKAGEAAAAASGTAYVSPFATSNVRARGGMLVGLPAEVPRSAILSEQELAVYVSEYERTGFRGGLNWYRNLSANWLWDEPTKDVVIRMPALMVTAGRDTVLTPAMSTGMEATCARLERAHIEECGHWTQAERPDELNAALLGWLRKHYAEIVVDVAAAPPVPAPAPASRFMPSRI